MEGDLEEVEEGRHDGVLGGELYEECDGALLRLGNKGNESGDPEKALVVQPVQSESDAVESVSGELQSRPQRVALFVEGLDFTQNPPRPRLLVREVALGELEHFGMGLSFALTHSFGRNQPRKPASSTRDRSTVWAPGHTSALLRSSTQTGVASSPAFAM